jgi:hypothetical protein
MSWRDISNVFSRSTDSLIILGKDELCQLSESDATNSESISEISNRSFSTFEYLYQIIETQPEARRANLSPKRSKAKQSATQKEPSGPSLDMTGI